MIAPYSLTGALALATALLAGVMNPAQEGGDAVAKTKAAVEKTRSQKSYRVSFDATVRVPDSEPMKIKGETVWVAPGVLFTQYTASGGETVRLLRLGEKVWLYHMLAEEWLSAEESGKPGAGRGMQNPDEVLAAVMKAADKAIAAGKDAKGEVLEMKLDGASLQKVMKQQVADGTLDWQNSEGSVRLVSGSGDGLMYKMVVSADVASTEAHLKGKKVGYTAEVTLQSYNKDFGLEFTDVDIKTRKTINLPWPAAFLNEAEKMTGVPEELKAEIRKRRK